MIKVVITIKETPSGVEVEIDGEGSRNVTEAETAMGDKLFDEVHKILEGPDCVTLSDTDSSKDPLN